MPARAKYNSRRINVRLDKEADEILQRLKELYEMTDDSKVIRKLILDAGKQVKKPSKP
jgi:hypothetical protein